MKYSTEYLFGKPRMRYEPCLTELATMRIEDGKELLKQLSMQRASCPNGSPEMDELLERYQAVEIAVKHWKKILKE